MNKLNNYQEKRFIRNKLFSKIINTFLKFLTLLHYRKSFKIRASWENKTFNEQERMRFIHEKPMDSLLIKEIVYRSQSKKDKILCLGCNFGRLLDALHKEGFTNLYGVDINKESGKYVHQYFPEMAKSAHLTYCSFEKYLPAIENNFFDIVFTHGTTINHVHPLFNIVKHITRVTSKYMIWANACWNSDSYPRFWEYEFENMGFMMVKFLRPLMNEAQIDIKKKTTALIVFSKI